MLGERHSLFDDFPQYKQAIKQLIQSDEIFADNNKRYTQIDKEIRILELKDSPIGDEAMHQLKHDRAELKDKLYQRLIASSD